MKSKLPTTSTTQSTIPATTIATAKWWPIAILIITAIAHISGINNGFVNWDDEAYIHINNYIKTLDAASIKTMFAWKSYYGGNYHPLVALTNAVEYNIAGMDATLYHKVNFALHLINTYLVFVFIKKLTTNNTVVAAVVALFFGIHPMHVESVAWISERKDVLYTLFYLLALITYVSYTKSKSILMFIATILLFLLSLLSKSMAVTLPLVLVLIDWYKSPTFNVKQQLNKIPFFALALLFGLHAIDSQSTQNYIATYNFTVIERFFLACYTSIYYIVKLFAPINLCTLIPFPQRGLSVEHYIAPIGVIALILLVIKSGSFKKHLLFGLGFYFATISIVLQLIPVGAAIVCERYTYVPYIGLLYIIALAAQHMYTSIPKIKPLLLPLLGITTIAFTYLSFMRNKVWEDGETLWRDTTEKYPESADYAWFGLGNILLQKGGDSATVLNAFNKALELNPGAANYLLNASNAYSKFGKRKEAVALLDKSVIANPNSDMAYYNRGFIKNEMNDFTGAIPDFTKTIALNSNNVQALFLRGLAYKNTGQLAAAILDYKGVIAKDKNFTDAYLNLGNVYTVQKNFGEAIALYNLALKQKPNDTTILINRAAAYFNNVQSALACQDIATAIQYGSTYAKIMQGQICK